MTRRRRQSSRSDQWPSLGGNIQQNQPEHNWEQKREEKPINTLANTHTHTHEQIYPQLKPENKVSGLKNSAGGVSGWILVEEIKHMLGCLAGQCLLLWFGSQICARWLMLISERANKRSAGGYYSRLISHTDKSQHFWPCEGWAPSSAVKQHPELLTTTANQLDVFKTSLATQPQWSAIRK